MGEDQSRQALAWMWEGRQGKKPHSRVSPRGREDRGEAGPRGGCGPAWPPSPRPLRVASVFRNVLSLAGAAKANGQGPGRGPGRWLAALTFSWPGPASPVDAAPRPWGAPASGGVGAQPGLRPSAEAPPWRAVLRCLKYLFCKGLTSR